MKRAPAALMIAAGMALAQPAAEPLSFKGFAWGTPRAEIERALPRLICSEQRCGLTIDVTCPQAYQRNNADDPCLGQLSYAGVVPRSVFMQFRPDGGLSSVILRFRERHFRDVTEAVIGRFGAPDRDVAEDGVRKLMWNRGGGFMYLAQRAGTSQDSSLFLGSTNAMEAEQAERRRKAAKDL